MTEVINQRKKAQSIPKYHVVFILLFFYSGSFVRVLPLSHFLSDQNIAAMNARSDLTECLDYLKINC